MAIQRITKRVVDAIQPGDRDVFLWDADLAGFGLKVTPTGKKTYGAILLPAKWKSAAGPVGGAA